jgi:hypothetical protein
VFFAGSYRPRGGDGSADGGRDAVSGLGAESQPIHNTQHSDGGAQAMPTRPRLLAACGVVCLAVAGSALAAN